MAQWARGGGNRLNSRRAAESVDALMSGADADADVGGAPETRKRVRTEEGGKEGEGEEKKEGEKEGEKENESDAAARERAVALVAAASGDESLLLNGDLLNRDQDRGRLGDTRLLGDAGDAGGEVRGQDQDHLGDTGDAGGEVRGKKNAKGVSTYYVEAAPIPSTLMQVGRPLVSMKGHTAFLTFAMSPLDDM